MQGYLTVYFNTGFNGIDIPSEPSVLALANQKQYTDIYYTREDIDKPYFDVKDSYENLKNCDYLAYTVTSGNTPVTSYYFCVPTALSKGVTRLSCDLDALLTMGGAVNLNYTGGWQERGHITKAEDTLFGNLATEDWVPTMPLYTAQASAFGRRQQGDPTDLDVVITSVDLNELAKTSDYTQDVIEGIPYGETDPTMYWPAMPVVSIGTEYSAYDWMENVQNPSFKTFKIPASCAYNYDEQSGAIRKGLKKLFSAGQLQLQASYKIPGEFLDRGDQTSNPIYDLNNPGKILQLRGCRKSIDASTYTFEYTANDHGQPYTVKNKKCFATYREFVLCNIGSSDMCIKTPEELYSASDENTYPTIYLWADPTSTGKPYARFKYIKDNPLQYADAVKGLQWNNNQIMMQGASGSLWNSIDAAFNRSTLEREKGMAMMNAGFAANATSLQLQQAVLNRNQQVARDAMGVAAGAARAYLGAPDPTFGVGAALGVGITGTTKSLISQKMADDQMQLSNKMIQNRYNQTQYNADMQLAQLQQNINQNEIGLIKNNALVAPTLLFTPEQNLGLYGYNHFVIYEVRKSVEDLKSEDEYYQRYGYNGLHRPLTKDCFNTRQYYTFVQAYHVNIKSDTQSFGMRVRAKAISQLNKGVRVWKVLPDASYYETN